MLPILAQNVLQIGLIGLAVLIALIVFFLVISSLSLWFQGAIAGCRIPLFVLVGMKMRGTNANLVVQANIRASKAGLKIHFDKLETHYLARGNLSRVINALIAADKAGLVLDWEQATAIDLAGRDVLDAIKTSINPKVIDCPDPRSGKYEIIGVAKDGIQVKARARVTVRSCLERLIGGAQEETIIARVGEGIVTTIGSCNDHKEILKNPSKIAKIVIDAGLDSGTAFQILSIDIADIDIGENIGARLQASQAEADRRVAQAKAEERRALAVAAEQEQKANIVANQAQVVLAEAEVPLALARAFREGNFNLPPRLPGPTA